MAKWPQLLFTSGLRPSAPAAQCRPAAVLATTWCHCWRPVLCRGGNWPAPGLLLWCSCLSGLGAAVRQEGMSPPPHCPAWLRLLCAQAPENTFPPLPTAGASRGFWATSPRLFAKRRGSLFKPFRSMYKSSCLLRPVGPVNLRDLLRKNHYSKRIYLTPTFV